MEERGNKTIMCSVLFLDIVEYSKKSVSGQISLKDRFNTYLSNAIRDVPVADRIILDTGDGAAINFLGDVEDALKAALSMREAMLNEDVNIDPPLLVRIGINLGPVRLVRDINGQPNIVGDGINVAQRVMGFADASQILVSRSYYDAASRLSSDYAGMFHYQGSRTDKHVREHEIYAIGYPGDKTSPSAKSTAVVGGQNKQKSGVNYLAKLSQSGQKIGSTLASKIGLLRSKFLVSEQKTRMTWIVVGGLSLLLLLGGVAKLAKHGENGGSVGNAATQEMSAVAATAAMNFSLETAQPQPSSSAAPNSSQANDVAVDTGRTSKTDLATVNKSSPDKAQAGKNKVADVSVSKKNAHDAAVSKSSSVLPAKPAEANKDSYLVVTCTEGSVIFVDSVQKGKIAASQLTVSVLPGKHSVIVTHPVKGVYSQSIDVEADKTLRIKPNYCD